MATTPTSKRPMRVDAKRNYDLLLRHAETAFSEHGVTASLEDIARAAGVGIGTLYRHFPTRDALLEALLAERFEKARASADQLAASPDPVQALADWLREHVRSSAVYRGLPGSVSAVLSDPQSHLYTSCHTMREAAQNLLARAQQTGRIRSDLSATDVFLMANAIGWAAEQLADDPTRTERLLGLLMDGLRRTPG